MLLRIFHPLFLLALTALYSCQNEAKTSVPEAIVEAAPPCLDTSQINLRRSTVSFQDSIWQVQTDKRGLPAGKAIRAVYYHSKDCREDLIVFDSIRLAGPEIDQVIQVGNYFDSTIDIIRYPKVNFDDYNFDGICDFRIYSSFSDRKNRMFSYFLYDTASGQYAIHEGLSQTTNLSVNPEDKTLKTFNAGDHSGQVFTSSVFRFEQGELQEISRRQQVHDEAINKYIHLQFEAQDGRLQLIAADTLLNRG